MLFNNTITLWGSFFQLIPSANVHVVFPFFAALA